MRKGKSHRTTLVVSMLSDNAVLKNAVRTCFWKMLPFFLFLHVKCVMLLENAVTVEKCRWKMQMENAAGNACLFSTEVPNMLSF